MAQASEYGRGTGTCTINGEPTAKAGGTLRITGARPGVDGRYGIDEAEHNYSRYGGYMTQLTLKNPQPDTSKYVYGEAWGWQEKAQEDQRTPEQREDARREAERRRAQALADIGGAEPVEQDVGV